MLFNSFSFLLFFPLVCIVYYLIPRSARWIYLLAVSYFFYLNWQPIYGLLLLATTAATYAGGRLIEQCKNPCGRKWLLAASCLVPLGLLGFYKYAPFFNRAAYDLLDRLGIYWPLPEFEWLLPVGISFYTFMAVGYVTDVYRGTVRAERNPGVYALFIAFFPQVTSGPIGRAGELIPQLRTPPLLRYDNVAEGFRQMLWGYFLKLCVADRLAIYVAAVFDNLPHHNGSSILAASLMFTFQIYGDFAGYSLMAIGAAKIMGIDLRQNFRRPYFSQNIREFWSRWHISLSTWFRDYLYIPLGGNRVSRPRHMFNLMATFLVSGLWHGANWTFICWGGVHGAAQIAENLWKRHIHKRRFEGPVFKGLRILTTFATVSLAWIFFRANTLADAFLAIGKIFTTSGPLFKDMPVFLMGSLSLALLIGKDTVDEMGWRLHLLHSKYRVVSYLTAIGLICYILLFGVLDGGQFIYFQF